MIYPQIVYNKMCVVLNSNMSLVCFAISHIPYDILMCNTITYTYWYSEWYTPPARGVKQQNLTDSIHSGKHLKYFEWYLALYYDSLFSLYWILSPQTRIYSTYYSIESFIYQNNEVREYFILILIITLNTIYKLNCV